MNNLSFETALAGRVDLMLDACTKCGKCVEACPSIRPARICEDPQEIIAGVLDVVRTGHGPSASRQWASSCMLSGECIKACDYGVNPRFLLAMARVAVLKAENEWSERRRQAVQKFRGLAQDDAMLSRLQLSDELLERLGQKSASVSHPAYCVTGARYHGCARR
jgi:Fe-S oxidoreductase